MLKGKTGISGLGEGYQSAARQEGGVPTAQRGE